MTGRVSHEVPTIVRRKSKDSETGGGDERSDMGSHKSKEETFRNKTIDVLLGAEEGPVPKVG